MDVYSFTDYKPLLKERLREARARKKNWTFKKIADHLGIQATYLSKVLNSDSHHLGEEDLWLACKTLDFFPEESEFILLLRAQAIAKKNERKNELGLRIETLRDQRKLTTEISRTDSSSFTNEMDYLLNPLGVVLYAALSVDALRENVRLVGNSLGLKTPQLKDLLRVLERNDLVVLDPTDSLNVLKVKARRTHFSKDHPLMRTYQHLFKTAIQSRLSTTPEEEKQCLMATFTMDQAGFEELKKEFQVFLKKAEHISKRARHKEVYQLCFDMFRWI